MPLRSAMPGDIEALWSLFDAIDLVDGYYPLTEAAAASLRRWDGRGVVALEADAIVGFAYRYRDGDRFVVETAIDPSCRPVQTHLLLQAVVDDLGAAPVWLWASEVETLAAAGELGFIERRRLLQLVRSLPIEEQPSVRPGITIEPFRSGRDEDGLIEMNNAAFADHPDNADWDHAELSSRMARDWFDPDGLFVAYADDSLVGFCWTKHHPGHVGEIYVIGVGPEAQGAGLGRALTLIGLDHQHRNRGATMGMLYTEADNEAGLALYRSLGFKELRTKLGLARF